jgi:O-antigen ligase
MSSTYSHRPTPTAPDRPGLPAWVRYGFVAALVIVTSLLVAHEITSPDVRTMQILLAGLLVFAALRVSSFTTLLFIALAIPTYKPTTYGGTTLAFVLVLFILWLVRLTLKMERPAGRTSIDLPVAVLFCAYLLACSQLESTEELRGAMFNIFNLLTHIMVCFMVIHLTRTEKQLRILVGALVVMAVLIDLTALWELAFPGRALIPGWLDLGAQWAGEAGKRGLEIKGLRVAGVFFDYELLAEYCAMSMLLLFFVFARARTWLERTGMGALLVLNTFILFATVTRGAIVSLIVASLYLLWVVRKRVRLAALLGGLAIVFGAGWYILDFVANHTHSGNILNRFEKTEFKGFVPETRVGVWKGAWERILQKPIFGHGPYYEFKTKGIEQVLWPHNNYLFYWHTVGIIGLLAFLWLAFELLRCTLPRAPTLRDPSFSASFLLALQAMLVLFLVDQIKIEYLRNPVYPYCVWLFYGVIVATGRIVRQQQAQGSPATIPASSPVRLRPLPVAPVSPLASS